MCGIMDSCILCKSHNGTTIVDGKVLWVCDKYGAVDVDSCDDYELNINKILK